MRIKHMGVTFRAEKSGSMVEVKAVGLDSHDYIGLDQLHPRLFHPKVAAKKTAAYASDIQRANASARKAYIRAKHGLVTPFEGIEI
jgi:hypothetical protein